MDESLRGRADARLDQALATQPLATQPLADPRDLFRDHLRRLRAEDPPAFARAIDYFERTLVPRVAADAEPLAEWIEYGRFLAELSGRGRLVGIDASGRSRPFTPPPAADLVLFLPDDPAVPVLPVARPRELSDAQQATWDLLVAARRQR